MLRQGNNAAYLFCLQEFTSASQAESGDSHSVVSLGQTFHAPTLQITHAAHYLLGSEETKRRVCLSMMENSLFSHPESEFKGPS